jgi:hypothetical protein
MYAAMDFASTRRRRFRPGFLELEPRLAPSQAPLTPPEIAQAYGFDQIKLPGGYAATGQGQTIAIIEIGYTPTSVLQASLNTFDAGQGFGFTLPAVPNLVQQDLSNQADAGTETETLLDVEWAHALAPAANIIVFSAAPGSTDAQALANFMTAVSDATHYDGPLGQVSVVSMSYGFPESSVPTNLLASYDSIFTTPANHLGITFVASSGDDGAGQQARYPGNLEPPNYPASSPNVVGVGGTTVVFPAGATSYGYPGVATTAGGVGESAWGVGDLSYNRNDTPGGGTGGGISTLEPEPAYQSKYGLQYSNGTENARTTPDVSLNADAANSPVLIYDSYDTNQFGNPIGWTGIGGTSFSAPAWAALIAIADEARAAENLGTLDGATQTLPMLYQLSSNDFHDITQGNDGYAAGPGYDLATGLGTPVASRVVGDLWGQAAPVAKSATFSVNAGTTLTIAAAGGLLANDTDPLGEPLVVSSFSQPAHGSVTVNPDGAFTYQPTSTFAGTDSFTYSILDTGTGVSSSATVTITVTQGPPDLAQATPAGWSGPLAVSTQKGNPTTAATISTSDSVFVDWAFVNQGSIPITTGFQTELLLDGKVIQTWSFPGLGVGQFEQEMDIPLGHLAVGSHTVTVITDDLNQVTESNKDNNTETYTFTVTPPPLPAFAPDTPSGWSGPLVVSTQKGTTTSASTVGITDTVYIDWAFSDQSSAAITTPFQTELLLDGKVIQTWSFTGLGANQVEMKTDINLGVLPAGAHTVTVITDYQNQVTVSAASQNTLTTTFDVTQAPLADLTPFTPVGWSAPLVVSTLQGNTTTATTISTANTIYIDWAFINSGNTDITTPFQFELLLDGTDVQTWSATIPLDQSFYTYVTDFSLGSLSAGSHTVEVIADYLNQLTLGDRSTRTETYTFTIAPPGPPDLEPFTPAGWSGPLVVSTQFGFPFTATTITTADPVYIDWAFLNQGGSALTTDFTVQLLFDNNVVHTWTAAPLAPDNFTYVSDFSLTDLVGALSAGTHTIKVVADFGSQPATESQTFTVTLPPLPDLAPTTPSGWSGPLVISTQAGNTTTAPTITTSDNLYLDWAFVNQGSATIDNVFTTELLLDGNPVYQWVNNQPIAPTIIAYVSDFSLGQLSAGSHTLSVVADYNNDIAESNETNNTETLTIDVVVSPSISQQPADQTVVAGHSATFTAAASGTPAPTVQWQVSTDGGTTWSPLTGETAPTLTLNNVTAAMNGDKYKAVFTNAAGSVPTNLATLHVMASTTIAFEPAQSGSVVYGQDVTLTVTVTPNVAAFGAPVGAVQLALDGSNVGSPHPLTSGDTTIVVSDLAAGDDTITMTYTSSSSDFAGVTGTPLVIDVAKAPLTVSAGVAQKVYGQTLTIAGTEFKATGLVNGDTVSAVTLASPGTSPTASVGGYPITPSSATGTGLANYTITYVSGKLTVTPAPLLITAGAASRLYGAADPAFSGTVSGVQNNDAITVTYTTNATQASPVGSYAIVPAATGSALSNYSVEATDGTLTVVPVPVTVHLQLSSSTSVPGQPITVTISVTGAAGPATGTVTLEGLPGKPISLALQGDGSAEVTFALPAGRYSLSAAYVGDADFESSDPAGASLQVQALALEPAPRGKGAILVVSRSAGKESIVLRKIHGEIVVTMTQFQNGHTRTSHEILGKNITEVEVYGANSKGLVQLRDGLKLRVVFIKPTRTAMSSLDAALAEWR